MEVSPIGAEFYRNFFTLPHRSNIQDGTHRVEDRKRRKKEKKEETRNKQQETRKGREKKRKRKAGRKKKSHYDACAYFKIMENIFGLLNAIGADGMIS